jgi:subtilase family serine protease
MEGDGVSGSHRRKALIAAGGVAGLTAAAALIAVPASAVTPDHVPLAGTQPAWATSSAAHGAVPAGRSQDLRVYLAPKGGTANLKAAVAAVSTPGSASYRHYLNPAQYNARFAPTSAEVAKVRSWVSGAGLHVAGVASDHSFVRVTGTAAAAERAFSVGLKLYSHQGRTVQAPAANAQVPAAVASSVIGVVGLDTAPHLMTPNTVTDATPAAKTAPKDSDVFEPGFRNARPCSSYYGQLVAKFQGDFTTPLPKFDGKFRKYAICGYIPSQLRSAYGVNDTTLTGKGATVAITDAYALPTIKADANQYATNQGDAKFAPGQFTQSKPSSFTDQVTCDAPGWSGEEALDVEAVHGMAPNANIKYYASKSCFDADFLDALKKVVTDNKASIVSNSWGDLGEVSSSGVIAAYTQVFLQGAMQGISFQFSSGDNGDELATTGMIQPDDPASNPYVTAVGGTSTAIDANGKMLWQSGWGTEKYALSANGKSWSPLGFTVGAGGGYSHVFNLPSYQQGVVPASAPAGRAVPDVAMDADTTTGMLIGLTQDFPEGIHYGQFRIGGTSVASPLFAGIQALKTELNGGTRIGFANPALYKLAGSGEFTDVLPVHTGDGNVRPDFVNSVDTSDGVIYSVRTFDQDSSLKVTKGWDDVTGIGTPNAAYLGAK